MFNQTQKYKGKKKDETFQKKRSDKLVSAERILTKV